MKKVKNKLLTTTIGDAELAWSVYELPESSRVFMVQRTRICKVYGLLPDPEDNIYKTRNAAKRAVARYRKESEDYLWSHPGSAFKNVNKMIKISFEKAWDEFETAIFDLGCQTIKIAKIKSDGLADYYRIEKEQ